MWRKGIPLTLGPVVLTMFALVSAANSAANNLVWAKKGTAFFPSCSRPFKRCRALRIPSPDNRSAVEITYNTTSDYPDIETATLRVTTLGRNIGEVQPVASVEDEITWSPDSKAFFMNGNENANGWEYVAVHMLDDPNLGPGYITGAVAQDMVRSFPPCQARDPIDICVELAAKPDDFAGVVGLDWIGNSSMMVVMAEVPCSSSMGGIMCQVLGYEIEVPSGRILHRMEPKEFARRWQHSMAWKFHDPGPPEFKAKARSTPN
jgi:hypothetical protein